MTDKTQMFAQGRVTLDDVRGAIGDTNPNETNAAKVRIALGDRGSFGTIQKHLDTLRQELATRLAPPATIGAVPPMPTDAAAAMWTAAWSAAQAVESARMLKLSADRDAALLRLDTTLQDVAGLVATVDDQTTRLEQAAMTAAELELQRVVDMQTAAADRAAAAEVAAGLAAELERARASIAEGATAAKHASELSEAGRVAMREELARLTDQIGELKAHLYKRVEAISAVPAVTDPEATDPPPAAT